MNWLRPLKAANSFQIFHPTTRIYVLYYIFSLALAYSDEKEAELPQTSFAVPLVAAHQSHHAYIYIGSPAQRRLVIVDTGSKTLVFPCDPCRRCGRNHFSTNYFRLETSTTDIVSSCKDCVFPSNSVRYVVFQLVSPGFLWKLIILAH